MLGALERVAHGEKFYKGPVLRITLQSCERAVLRRVAFGMENPQIAQELNISVRTVENRIANLKEKLGLQNRVGLALYYLGMHPGLWNCGKLTL